MKNGRTYFVCLLSLLSILFFTGCIYIEEWRIEFEIAPDLSGAITHNFRNISISEELIKGNLSLAEKKIEEEGEESIDKNISEEDIPIELEKVEAKVKELIKEISKDIVEEIATIWNLKDFDVQTHQRDKNSFDLKITAKFDNFAQIITPLLNSKEFSIKRTKKYLYFDLREIENEKDVEDVIISIKYQGKILKNNAHHYDKENHIMEWNLAKATETGIKFKLDLRSD